MKKYKHSTTTKAQRSIACLLLACQLLTSCGGNEILLPIDQQATMQATTCIDDDRSALDTQPTSFIDDTPLKLGQPEVKFVWNDHKGLQALVGYPRIGPKAIYVPAKLPDTINPGICTRLHLILSKGAGNCSMNSATSFCMRLIFCTSAGYINTSSIHVTI